MGPTIHRGVYEHIHELVVIRAADTLIAPSDVERISQAPLVIRAYIQQDRQCLVGMNAGARSVQRQLADGDAHAASALIAETEDSLAVTDDNDADAIVARVSKNRRDPLFIGIA